MIFHFENYTLDLNSAQLLCDEIPVEIEPQVLAIIEILVRRSPSLVTKQELIDHVWDGRAISDAAVNSRIWAARNALGDDGRQQRLIKTVHGRGFRFTGLVETPDTDAALLAKAPSSQTGRQSGRRAALILLLPIAALAVLGFVFAPSLMPASTRPAPAMSADQDRAALSIAVLPFTDMSATGQNDYFAAGMSEELLNVLSRVNGLKVASRTSSFSAASQNKTAAEIAQSLGVDHIIEGSIRIAGSDIRITAQLIDARNDTHLWAGNFDRPLTPENILNIQDEISRHIVSEMSTALRLPETPDASTIGSMEDYQHYLRGMALMRESTPSSFASAIKEFETVIQNNPAYAPAYAGLAETYNEGRLYAGFDFDLVVEKMKQNIEIAMELSPNLPSVQTAAAALANLEFRYEDALDHTDLALELAPNKSLAYHRQGAAWLAQGEFAKGMDSFKQALALDPLSATKMERLTSAQILNGDVEDALRTAQNNFEWNPENATAIANLAYLYRNQGDYVTAADMFEQAARINPYDYMLLSNRYNLYRDINLPQMMDAAAVNSELKAINAFFKGQPSQARQIIIENPNDFDMEHPAYLIGDHALAHDIAKRLLNSQDLLSSSPVGHSESYWFTQLYYVTRDIDPQAASILGEKIGTFFSGKSPQDIPIMEDLIGGMAWQVINDEPDAAMAWLDEAIARGHVFVRMKDEPIFKTFANRPAFARRQARMEERAQAYRDHLATDLGGSP